VAESAISFGVAGTSTEGAENTATIAAGLVLTRASPTKFVSQILLFVNPKIIWRKKKDLFLIVWQISFSKT